MPLGAGLSGRAFTPQLASRLARPLAAIAGFLLLMVLGLLIANEFQTLCVIRWTGWMGMLLLTAASLLIGWYCADSDRSIRKTMSNTTGL